MPKQYSSFSTYIIGWICLVAFLGPFTASVVTPAVNALSVGNSLDVTALVLPSAPTSQAVIGQPVNGQRFNTTPLVINGSCAPNLLVRVYNNGQLAGSITCSPIGDFVMNITLLVGQNVLTSLNFDQYEQVGPVAPSVTVYVDSPPEGQAASTSPPLQITRDGTTIIGAAGQSPVELPNNRQILFEGTVIEPLTKALGITAIVSLNVNKIIAIVANGMLVIATLLLLAILLLRLLRYR